VNVVPSTDILLQSEKWVSDGTDVYNGLGCLLGYPEYAFLVLFVIKH
jgi:hypothetical protein